MTIVELKRRDGEAIWVNKDGVYAWTRNVDKLDAVERTDIWIGGHKFTLGMTVKEVLKALK